MPLLKNPPRLASAGARNGAAGCDGGRAAAIAGPAGTYESAAGGGAALGPGETGTAFGAA